MTDKYDDNDDLTQVGTDATDIATNIMVDGYGDDDMNDVDAFDETHVVSGDVVNAYTNSSSLEVTDRAPGSILRRPMGKATLDLGSDVDYSDVDYGLDEDSEDEEDGKFSETNVLPITSDDVDATAIGDAIDGRFRLVGVLGEGGMGRVYRGVQISINRDVAIKVVLEEFAQDPELRQRFLREAQLISSFSHPNIVRLVDFGETDGRLYLAMEFVNGKPLSAIFGKKPVHPRYALQLMRQVTSALIEAHENGVVHRDLKPDNILLTRIADGTAQCKVLDFGVARTSASDLTAAGTVCGTPDYMAPEQARGVEVEGATDLYSVGCLLFELLAGRLPFMATSPVQVMLKQVNEEAPNVREFAPHLPEDIGDLVASLLEKNPEDRPRTAAELVQKIDEIQERYGWTSAIRLPVGPLIETTAAWHWKQGDVIQMQGASGQWLVGNNAAGSSGGLPSPSVPSFSLGGGPSSEASLDHQQSDFQPDVEFSLDRNAPPAPSPTPAPSAPSTPSTPAGQQAFGGGPQNFLSDLGAFPPLELDNAHSTPAPQMMGHGSAPTVDRPIPQMPSRAPSQHTAEMTSPQHGQQRTQETKSRTAPRRKAATKKDTTNTILAFVLVAMIFATGGVVYWIFVKNAGESAGESVEYNLSGEPKRIVDAFSTAGWTIASPPSTANLGAITSTSTRVAQGESSLRLDIYKCPTKEDVRTIFRQRAFPPKKGFHYKDIVVVLEAENGTSIGYTEVGMDILKKLEPGAITSVTKL